MRTTQHAEVKAFFDEPTNTVSHLVWDPSSKDSAIIDPVLNFDYRSGEANAAAADAVLVEAQNLGPQDQPSARNYCSSSAAELPSARKAARRALPARNFPVELFVPASRTASKHRKERQR